MRWRDIRFEKPTEADADKYGKILQLLDHGGVCTWPWNGLSTVVAWMPTSELPEFEPVPDTPKPKYRPFANATEFAPYADKWIARANKENPTIAGAYRPAGYDDHGIWVVIETNRQTYRELFDQGRRFLDGSVFGVEVTE